MSDIPLREFIDAHYLPYRKQARKGKPLKRESRYQINSIAARIKEVTGREAMVSDLNDAMFSKLLAHHAASGRTSGKIATGAYFFGLLKCAIRAGLIEENASPPQQQARRLSAEERQILLSLRPKEAAEKLKWSISEVYSARSELWIESGGTIKFAFGKPPATVRKESLAMDPGTLNFILHNNYYPRNQKIQCSSTKTAYDKALRDFRDSLGHEPTLNDLSDEAVERYQGHLHATGISPHTTNERVGRVIALWNWCARKRMVNEFPAITKLREPKRIPIAWSREQIDALFVACRAEKGTIAGIPAGLWWESLHLFVWDTGERIGAVMRTRWEWLDWKNGHIIVLAEARKGRQQDMSYHLHPDTLENLRKISQPNRELIFPWQGNESTFYNRYNRILQNAGLPDDRKSKMHRMRRSVASHLQAAGVDASSVLAHSSQEVTRTSYLDPNIVNSRKTHEVLFRPGAERAGGPGELPATVSDLPLAFDAGLSEFL